jgi:hypothetical protein
MLALAASEARPKLGALNLVVRLDRTPGLVANCAGNVDFQSNFRHGKESGSDEMTFGTLKF